MHLWQLLVCHEAAQVHGCLLLQGGARRVPHNVRQLKEINKPCATPPHASLGFLVWQKLVSLPKQGNR